MLTPGFEFTDFATADVQVHAWGETINAAFEQTVHALMKTMIQNPESIGKDVTKEISITAPDKEILLVDFLSNFLALFDIEQLLISEIRVHGIQFDTAKAFYTISATVYGEIYNSEKHVTSSEVKAITFSYLKIEEKKERTDILVIFDM